MDADVYGPNVPTMMGVTDQPKMIQDPVHGEMFVPPSAHGVKVMSMGFLSARRSTDGLARTDASQRGEPVLSQSQLGRPRLSRGRYASGNGGRSTFARATGSGDGLGSRVDASRSLDAGR